MVAHAHQGARGGGGFALPPPTHNFWSKMKVGLWKMRGKMKGKREMCTGKEKVKRNGEKKRKKLGN